MCIISFALFFLEVVTITVHPRLLAVLQTVFLVTASSHSLVPFSFVAVSNTLRLLFFDSADYSFLTLVLPFLSKYAVFLFLFLSLLRSPISFIHSFTQNYQGTHHYNHRVFMGTV